MVAVVDTNCDPTPIDYLIPANDDAIRAIKLIVTKMADAVLEGKQQRKDVMPEGEALVEEDRLYLGDSTLAKLRSGELEFGEAESDEYVVEYEEEEEDYEEGDLEYEDEIAPAEDVEETEEEDV